MLDDNVYEKTYVRKLDAINPSPDSMVTVCITNDIIEVKVHEYGFCNNLSKFRKISSDQYLNLETGELIHFQSKMGRNDAENSSFRRNWNRAFERLRRIINNNFVGNPNELHLILTYGNEYHMTDRGKAADDFKKFWKRLIYYYGFMDYIVMYEPNEQGIWHIHVLVKKSAVKILFLDNQSVQDIWALGFTKVRRTSGNDNIGAYFTILLRGSDDNSKKASRIQYYEKHKKLYTKSRGILVPPIYRMTYQDAEKILQDHTKVFEAGYSILLESDNCEVNRIYIMQYNDRRNEK